MANINAKYKKVSEWATAPETIIQSDAEEKKKPLDDLICPKCKSKLVLRTEKKGANAGNQFYGCSNFPKCRYIQKL